MPYLAIIVDDDLSSRFIYQQVLKTLNFTVLEATDGAQARELLATHTPDLLFLDMLLPQVSGVDVLDYAHRLPHLAHTVIVAISAHSGFRETIPLAPNDQFLLKPVMTRTIREIAQRAIAASASPV